MNPDDLTIRHLVLSFFEKIGSRTASVDGAYEVMSLPERYARYFGSEKILFAFDAETASQKRDCELIIPGSRILSLIITNCISKGPISVKKKPDTRRIIRYYFAVTFSGITNMTKIIHIDIDLDTCMPIGNVSDKENHTLQDTLILELIGSQKTNVSYMSALDELQRQCETMRTDFINHENMLFQKDYELFATKYDSHIRELNDRINRKERSLDDEQKIKKFRFETLEDIRRLEQDKVQLVDTLQEKHKLSMEYSLIACVVISG